MPCRSNLDLTPAAFISLPPYNNGLPIPLFDFKPPQDSRLSINTLEAGTPLVARTKKAASVTATPEAAAISPKANPRTKLIMKLKRKKVKVSEPCEQGALQQK